MFISLAELQQIIKKKFNSCWIEQRKRHNAGTLRRPVNIVVSDKRQFKESISTVLFEVQHHKQWFRVYYKENNIARNVKFTRFLCCCSTTCSRLTCLPQTTCQQAYLQCAKDPNWKENGSLGIQELTSSHF